MAPSSNPWRRRQGPAVRDFLRQAARDHAVIPKNECIALALKCDESTVRRIMGEMQDSGEIVVYPHGMKRVVRLLEDA